MECDRDMYCEVICCSNKFAVNIGLQNAHIKLHIDTDYNLLNFLNWTKHAKLVCIEKAAKHSPSIRYVLQPLNRLISDPQRGTKTKPFNDVVCTPTPICNTVHWQMNSNTTNTSRYRDSLIHTYIIPNGNVATQTKESILNGNWSGFWYVTRSARINSYYEAFTHFYTHTFLFNVSVLPMFCLFQTYLLTYSPSSFRIHSFPHSKLLLVIKRNEMCHENNGEREKKRMPRARI